MIAMTTNSIRPIYTKCVNQAKVRPSNLKGKSKSSQLWLQRQLSDPYVEKAKRMNYRCRSAFKLLEIDDRFKILKPGATVIDCGAAPGSWSQVCVHRTNADGSNNDLEKGTVISVDLLRIHPINGVIILDGTDFTSSTTQEKLKTILNGKELNCIVSDMAPNATGIRSLDQDNIVNLCYSVLKFALTMSAKGSSLLVKLWDSADASKLEKDVQRFYENTKRIKPNSSRADSSELFLLGRNFKGLR